jgi:probable F420-dependent oxidoreductase
MKSLISDEVKGLEFGLLLHTRHLIREDGGRPNVEEFWESAGLAEEIGFDHLWVGDAPRLSLLDRAHADCLTLMAALSARTRNVRIGTVPLIAGLRNPVLLAHALATLDVISGGRVILGVSVAPQYRYAEREFQACGAPFHQRAGRLNESIQIMRRLWTERSFAFEGKYYSFEEIGIEPKPIQKPIPIWVAAGDNESALRRVARLGDGWFTVAHSPEEFVARRKKIEAYACESGREAKGIASALFATFHIDRTREKAEEEGWAQAERYFHQPRSNLKHLSPFFGTPKECARRLQGYVESGLTAMVGRVVSPDVAGQMRLLIEELKPQISFPMD